MSVPVHHAPWLPANSPADGSPETGRSYVVLETAEDPHARVRVEGSAHGLTRCGPTGEGARELWELPTVWIATTQSAAPHVTLEITCDGHRTVATVAVPSPPELPLQDADDETEDDPVSPEARSFEQLLDHHVEATRHWLDGGEEQSAHLISAASGLTQVPLHEFCERYWELEDRVEAPLTLIVRIAQEVAPLIDELAGSPRRILRRERQQVPLGRAQQLDASCIRWLTRQPGRTMAQRAGPRQQVRAVVREPSIDTLENRVLRHFLELCRASANRYLNQHRDHSTSPRVTAVRRLRSHVDQLLRDAPIGTVGQLQSVPEPNYVLQFDDRYSTIWTWYLRLIRQEQEKDDLRAWHHRVWAERCRTAVWSCLERSCVRPQSFRGQLALRSEAKFGSFYHLASASGPWAYQRVPKQHVVRLLSRSQAAEIPILEPLQRAACDFVVVRHNPFDTRDISATLAVLCMHVPLDDDAATQQRLTELDATLSNLDLQVSVAALLITPHRATTKPLQQSSSRHSLSVRLPLPDSQDKSPGWTALDRVLSAFTTPPSP